MGYMEEYEFWKTDPFFDEATKAELAAEESARESEDSNLKSAIQGNAKGQTILAYCILYKIGNKKINIKEDPIYHQFSQKFCEPTNPLNPKKFSNKDAIPPHMFSLKK